MRKGTFILLTCACVVCVITQETNHQYYKYTNDAIGDYNLRFKVSNGIGRRMPRTNNYEVKGHYSYFTPNNQQLNVFYSPGLQGYHILSLPTTHPTLTLPVFKWLPSANFIVTYTQTSHPIIIQTKLKPSEAALGRSTQFIKLPFGETTQTTFTERSIEEYFKYIFKPKSNFDNALDMPIVGTSCNDDLPPHETSPSSEDLGVTEEMPIMIRFDIKPFGEGPENLRSREKINKINFSPNQIHDYNNKNLKISKDVLTKSVIGPRFQDC